MQNLSALEFDIYVVVFFQDPASGAAQSRRDFVTWRTHDLRRFG